VLATPGYSAYIKSPKAATILQLLHHSPASGTVPFAAFRIRHRGSGAAGAIRRPRNHPHRQDTTCFGEDLGLKDGLALLLERLAGVAGLQWIRFLYAYPNKITGRLLATIAAHDNICSYIDVPLQHASPTVLKRMKRGGGADLFLRSLEKMRRVIPVYSADFVHCRLPGETEKNSKSFAAS